MLSTFSGSVIVLAVNFPFDGVNERSLRLFVRRRSVLRSRMAVALVMLPASLGKEYVCGCSWGSKPTISFSVTR